MTPLRARSVDALFCHCPPFVSASFVCTLHVRSRTSFLAVATASLSTPEPRNRSMKSEPERAHGMESILFQ
jgi:hypothetical protein